MTVSKLKEAFAFAETVEERELLVKQLAVQGSDDWIYYTGLILLQKLHSEMSLVEDCSRLREPTARESELMQEMRDFLAKYKDKDTEELEIRFNILIYPINADDASEFLRRKLGIQELAQLQQQQQQSHSPDSTPTPTQHRFNSAKRSSLDQSFLEPQRLLKNVLKSPNEYTRMKVLAALPELAKMNLDELSAEERRNLAWLLTRYPVASSYTEFVTQALSGYLNESTNLSHLTLEQLDKLRSSDPSLNEKKEFMEAYLCKLQPHRFLHQATKTGSWDDSQGILEEYVSTAWEFIKSMSSPIFNPIKGLLLFYKLRIKAARQQFDDIELFREYYKYKTDMESTRFGGLHMSGLVTPKPTEQYQVVRAFLTGALKLDPNLQLDDEKRKDPPLEGLVAEIMLTYKLDQDITKWQKKLQRCTFDELLKKTELEFEPSTLYVDKQLLPSDTVSLQLRVKNIPSITVRVFQLDLFQYFRLHPELDSVNVNDINLDGLCPSWETTRDYSHVDQLQTFTETFDFKGDEEPFKGRGAWIVDIMGARESCRAIIKKGHLRHIDEVNAAGHSLTVVDENNIPFAKGDIKLWFNGKFYEPEKLQPHQIWLPFLPRGEWSNKAFLLSTSDGYCEPIKIDNVEESYRVEADITLHTESLVPNKAADMFIVPRVTIHGADAPLDVIKEIDVSLTMENSQGIKSTLTFKEVDFTRNKPIKIEFNVPPALQRISCKLDFTLDYTTNADSTCSVYQQDIPVDMLTTDFRSMYLEAGFNGYRLHILGKNGESIPKAKVELQFDHVMVDIDIGNTLYTDEKGVIDLGRLENVSQLRAVCGTVIKVWNLLLPYSQAVLPEKIHQVANEPFAIAYGKGPNRSCTLVSIGDKGHVVKDFTDVLTIDNECVRVPGLPEGTYLMVLTDFAGRGRSIKCIVNQPASQEAPIKNWTLGQIIFTENTGVVTDRPLHIKQVDISEDTVAIDLANWSSNSTFAFVSSSSFVPTSSAGSTLKPSFSQSRLKTPASLKSPIVTACHFLSGRKLSEELCYILGRSRQEKWVGSTLNKPSLLLYPKKNAETSTEERKTEDGHGFTMKNVFPRGAHLTSALHPDSFTLSSSSMIDYFDQASWSDLAFLNHRNPVLCLRPDENGRILVDRNDLGQGNVLQMAVFGHDSQAVSRQVLLSDAVASRKVDLRQSVADPSTAFLRSKSIAKLGSSSGSNTLTLDLNRHEWELVDNFETVFDLCKLLSESYVAEDLDKFEFLKTWHDMELEKKLEKHQEMPCHELNLWLKYKDPVFFDQHVRPYISCKVHKTFMDNYLIDANLEKYSSNLSLYRQLNNLELALLAKRDPSILPIVVKSFKDTYTAPSESEMDNKFDTVLARNALHKDNSMPVEAESYMMDISEPHIAICPPAPPSAVEGIPVVTERGEALNSLQPASLFGGAATRKFKAAFARSAPGFGSAAAQPVEEEETDGAPSSEEEGPVEDEEMEKRQQEMREAWKKRPKPKKPYEFVKPTAEYKEMGYYNTMSCYEPVSGFLLDFLASESGTTVLSGEFIHSIYSLRAVLFILTFLEIPYKDCAKCKLESDPGTGVAKIVTETPCLVFYRMLESLPVTSVANPSILIGQGFFLKEEHRPVEDEGDNLVEWDDLRPLTEYGWHLALSNIFPKTRTVEVTLQVPTGSIPTRQTSYCSSRTIKIAAYSTWHEVVGSFYFPEVGDFKHLSVSVAESGKILGQTDPLDVIVKPATVADLESKSVSWSTVASEGSDDRVLGYLKEADLSKLDLSLLEWRMVNPEFALNMLETLRSLKFYSWNMWQFGLHHRSLIAVRELLENDAPYLLDKCGTVLETPLVNIVPFESGALEILDYYPVVNARAHALGDKKGILNRQLSQQYDRFLSYLTRKSTSPNSADLLTLGTYLVTQDRISEARKIYSRLCKVAGNADDGQQIQMDYLNAYLQTRIQVDEIQDKAHLVDLESTRNLVTKHLNCSSLRWRKMFTSMKDFLDEVEKRQQRSVGATEANVTDERKQARSVLSEAVLDFSIKDNNLHLTYANVDQVQIRYYKMNVEVMFSNNPFMAGKSLDTSYGWIKPSYEETRSLTSSDGNVSLQNEAEADEDDFDVIGIGRLGAFLAKIKMPAELACSDVMVEVSGGGLTRRKAHFSHKMLTHFVETFGMVRVAEQGSQIPIAGAYVKVYARMKDSRKHQFWKDGYTGLNGVFDYVSVTEGNALVSGGPENLSLKQVVSKIDKFSLFIESKTCGAVVEEVFPPEA